VTPSRPAPLLAAAALVVAVSAGLLGAGCGGSDSTSTGGGGSDSTSTGGGVEDSSSRTGQVRVVWQEPESEEDKIGYELLQAAETEGVATELAEEFELPHPLLVRGVNGYGEGPFYLGEDNSITLPYGFAALVLEVLAEAEPENSEAELEEQANGVNSFILAHEFAHALIENFELPVLGKEEDAADSISTALLLEVPGGDEYAADAALFWAGLSGEQESHSVAEYADSHSLDIQRAYNILCWVAGSSEASYEEVAELEVLPASRLETCPDEYEQLVTSVERELEPHLKG
jgi:hypothetical protein